MDTLDFLHIPNVMKNLILYCISSTNSINWNGNPTPSFTTTRGLRQGDPLSPYLFVLALERFGHIIQDMVDEGLWKPLTFGRGSGPNLSHVCFANDIVLFAEANVDQAHVIRNMLEDFCNNSGQKVNLGKSKVFFSKNVREDTAAMLSTELGIDQTKDLGPYLGTPMIHQRISKNTFNFMLEKMRKKLSSWKSNNLSFAGRLTLAQSCLASIPGYIMQNVSIPISVCNATESICKNFLWGSTESQRKSHLISWERICHPKDQGSLGFRKFFDLNKAYMTKLAWQLVNNPEKIVGPNYEIKIQLWSSRHAYCCKQNQCIKYLESNSS